MGAVEQPPWGGEQAANLKNGQAVEQIGDSSQTPTYLTHDLLGSIRLLTNASGVSVGTYIFSPYGKVAGHTGSTVSSIGYSGNLTDALPGLVYMRARDYDPATDQFVEVDPAVAFTHQPYTYASNNPLLATDPTGLFTWGWGATFGTIASIAGIAGLVLDATGVLAPVGVALEGVSLIAGGFAIASDCAGAFGQKVDSGSCALDIVSEATAGVGGIAKGISIGARTTQAFDGGLRATSALSAGINGADEVTSVWSRAFQYTTAQIAGLAGVGGVVRGGICG